MSNGKAKYKTLDLNFYVYQAIKQPGYTKTWKQRKNEKLTGTLLHTCGLVIYKTLVRKQNLTHKVVFIVLIYNADHFRSG